MNQYCINCEFIATHQCHICGEFLCDDCEHNASDLQCPKPECRHMFVGIPVYNGIFECPKCHSTFSVRALDLGCPDYYNGGELKEHRCKRL